MSDKSREEFESWYLKKYFEGGKQCGLEWLSTDVCGSYRYERPGIQWEIWQASRAALEIELPDNFDPDGGGQWAMWQDLVVRSIEDAGVKVKP